MFYLNNQSINHITLQSCCSDVQWVLCPRRWAVRVGQTAVRHVARSASVQASEACKRMSKTSSSIGRLQKEVWKPSRAAHAEFTTESRICVSAPGSVFEWYRMTQRSMCGLCVVYVSLYVYICLHGSHVFSGACSRSFAPRRTGWVAREFTWQTWYYNHYMKKHENIILILYMHIYYISRY